MTSVVPIIIAAARRPATAEEVFGVHLEVVHGIREPVELAIDPAEGVQIMHGIRRSSVSPTQLAEVSCQVTDVLTVALHLAVEVSSLLYELVQPHENSLLSGVSVMSEALR